MRGERTKEVWLTLPEYRARVSAAMRAHWTDPEYRAKNLKHVLRAGTIHWEKFRTDEAYATKVRASYRLAAQGKFYRLTKEERSRWNISGRAQLTEKLRTDPEFKQWFNTRVRESLLSSPKFQQHLKELHKENYMGQVVRCPECGTKGGNAVMHRWHLGERGCFTVKAAPLRAAMQRKRRKAPTKEAT